jgi:hypothetical protein
MASNGRHFEDATLLRRTPTAALCFSSPAQVYETKPRDAELSHDGVHVVALPSRAVYVDTDDTDT